jgi:hypothetical protein
MVEGGGLDKLMNCQRLKKGTPLKYLSLHFVKVELQRVSDTQLNASTLRQIP